MRYNMKFMKVASSHFTNADKGSVLVCCNIADAWGYHLPIEPS
jgi:hypothetical protein